MNIIKKRDKPISEVLQLFVKSEPLINKGLSTLKIEDIYHEIVGEFIAKYTEKVKLDKQGKLTLLIKSAPLKAELSQQKQKLIDQINSKLEDTFIKELVIK